MSEPLLSVNNIEVIYDHVILVLKGVSLEVPEGGMVALLGANGAGKTTTLKAVSNLLRAERGDVTKGSIIYRGERVQSLTSNDLVKRGVVQVMEGRHCFEHLTVEENLMTGAYTRPGSFDLKRGFGVLSRVLGSGAITVSDAREAGELASGQTASVAEDLEKVYEYFPRLRERRSAQAGYTSGGEQQMVAIGRALMARPRLILLDEASMGLAPQLVEEIFDIVRQLNENEGVTFLLAEQNTNMALKYAKYGYILENGRVVMDGEAGSLRENEDVKEFYLGLSSTGRRSYRDVKHYKRRKRWLA